MIIRLDRKKLLAFFITAIAGVVAVIISYVFVSAEKEQPTKSYIKWAELNVSLRAFEDAMKLDIESYDKLYHISWIDTLSYLAVKNGNSFSSYKSSDIESMLTKLGETYTVDDLMKDNKYYDYYKRQ